MGKTREYRTYKQQKSKISDDELFAELLIKAYDFGVDKNGKSVLKRNETPLTLDETAFMIWNIEGRKTAKPLSKMMILKTEQSAMAKLRKGLAKYGINSLDDVFEPVGRTSAKTYGSTDCPE